MYRISIHDYFSSAHQLHGYQGTCEELHGHNWKVEVEVQGEELDKIGLLIDFRILKEILKKVMAELDHTFLNNHPAFKEQNPSSELISRYIYQQIQKRIPAPVQVSSVTVWESESAKSTYFE